MFDSLKPSSEVPNYAARRALAIGALLVSSLALDGAIHVGGAVVDKVAALRAGTPDILREPHKIVATGPHSTVWEVASEAVGRQGDPRPVETEIEKALGTDTLQPYEVVPVPEDSKVGTQVPSEK